MGFLQGWPEPKRQVLWRFTSSRSGTSKSEKSRSGLEEPPKRNKDVALAAFAKRITKNMKWASQFRPQEWNFQHQKMDCQSFDAWKEPGDSDVENFKKEEGSAKGLVPVLLSTRGSKGREEIEEKMR